MFFFYDSIKDRKISDFLLESGDIEMKIWLKWVNIIQNTSDKNRTKYNDT